MSIIKKGQHNSVYQITFYVLERASGNTNEKMIRINTIITRAQHRQQDTLGFILRHSLNGFRGKSNLNVFYAIQQGGDLNSGELNKHARPASAN